MKSLYLINGNIISKYLEDFYTKGTLEKGFPKSKNDRNYRG